MKSFAFAVALSAAAFFYGTGLHPHWWLTWIAAVPVLAFAYGATAARAAIAAFLAYFLGALNLWGYFKVLEIPVPVHLLAFIATAVAFTARIMLSRLFILRSRHALALISLPVLWVAFEFAMSWGRNGTALNLAYSQMNCLPVVQIASVTGIWGISFLALLFASPVAQFIHFRTLPPRLAVSTVAVFIAIFTFGAWRLNQAPRGPSVRVGLAATDQRPLLGDETRTAAIASYYAGAIEQLSRQGAGIVVLPEKITTTSNYREGDFYRTIREAAVRNSVTVVAGIDQQEVPLKRNLAFVASPSIDLLYQKHHLVVGWEDPYAPGTSTITLPPPNETYGIEICKDMDFPRLSRTYGNNGVRLVLVPAWDFEVDDWLHGRMAVLRGVESGFAIARSAKQGFMTISDSRGRILYEARSNRTGDTHVIGTIRLSDDRTLYSRFGDWFAWLDLATLTLLLVSCVRFPSKNLSRP